MKRPRYKPGKRRQHSELVWLGRHAGFSSGHCYGWLLPEPEYILKDPSFYYRPDGILPVSLADAQSCPLLCPDPKCREWTNVQLVAGETRKEAMDHILAGTFAGWAYHVSECEMHDDRPPPPKSRRRRQRSGEDNKKQETERPAPVLRAAPPPEIVSP